jgi:hypothetical protein
LNLLPLGSPARAGSYLGTCKVNGSSSVSNAPGAASVRIDRLSWSDLALLTPTTARGIRFVKERMWQR